MQTEQITCKNCGNHFTGNFCNNCGEKVYTEHDRTATHFLEEGFHFLTHFEGTFFTTIKTIFTKPGKVSVDYAFGIRKKYFRLLSLFLLLVVLYLLFPAFEGLNMRLGAHEKHALYGAYAKEKVKTIMAHKHWSEEHVAEVFHTISEKTSKILLVVLIPFTALAVWAVTFKKRKYAFDQMVFATEINCFYLLWGFLVLPLLLMALEWLFHLITRKYFPFNDDASFFMIAIPFIAFAIAASRRFFGLKIWQSILFALYFLVIHTFIVHYLYKFILFVTVINQIH
jgi:hypothetical protein